MRGLWAGLLALVACGNPSNQIPTHTTPDGCSYPEDSVDPMKQGKPLAAYWWNKALHRDGREAKLDLGRVPCNDSEEIDWSPFDVLLFVSIPAW